MRTALMALMVSLLATGAAGQPVPMTDYRAVQTGTFMIDDASVEAALLIAANARPLGTAESIRFTGAYAMTVWPGVVIDIRPGGDGAEVSVVTLKRTGVHWQVMARAQFEITMDDYRALARLIDKGFADWAPETSSKVEDGVTTVISVCVDGASYLTERRTDGAARWLEGDCGSDHPNNAIARRLYDLMPPDVRRPLRYLRRQP